MRIACSLEPWSERPETSSKLTIEVVADREGKMIAKEAVAILPDIKENGTTFDCVWSLLGKRLKEEFLLK